MSNNENEKIYQTTLALLIPHVMRLEKDQLATLVLLSDVAERLAKIVVSEDEFSGETLMSFAMIAEMMLRHQRKLSKTLKSTSPEEIMEQLKKKFGGGFGGGAENAHLN